MMLPKPNRLVNAKSPYLLQHSHNPVEWYPWGEEAFSEARRRSVPVFLSIGYSTCHWCHVMAHESFEDTETARNLNRTFVCVKVDREERPDIDATYMRFCQMLTGSGGWPLTILMTSEKEPFFAATYLPKKSRGGMLGLDELIKRVSSLWMANRYQLITEAASNFEALSRVPPMNPSAGLKKEVLETAYSEFAESYDKVNGGFGYVPKFPSPHNLMFLLRIWRRTNRVDALNMVTHTLRKMASGGIRDHLGGGFHRYSTDASWTLPHFEKMLYDQATIAMAFIEAFQATGDLFFAGIARETADYVLDALTSPEGGFYSAEDADSEGEEGRFYTWTDDELAAVLDHKEHQVATQAYNISIIGNFREKPRANILTETKSPDSIVEELHITRNEYDDIIRSVKNKLYVEREKRAKPPLDDKILADWNGLMIAALARIGSVLADKLYIEAAIKAAGFIKEKMMSDTLFHSHRLGETSIPAFLDDYSYLAWGLIELYGATFDVEHLLWAKELVDDANRLFWDRNMGGYNISRPSVDSLPNIKETHDGAKPSGNSVMAMNLIRLGRIFGEVYEEIAENLFKAMSSEAECNPTAYSYLLCGYTYSLGPSHEVVVVGDRDEEEKITSEFRQSYYPNTILMVKSEELANLIEYTSEMGTIDGSPAIYVCSNRSCGLPVADVSTALREIEASYARATNHMRK